MKRALFAVMVIMSIASLAFAQAGSIGIFGDLLGYDCTVYDLVAGLQSHNVLHVLTPGATACQFSSPLPACYLGSYLSDTAIFPVTIGNSQTGVAVGYGGCQAAPIHVLTINVFGQGLTGTCCYWPTLADPNVPSGQVEVVDCANNLLVAFGHLAVINPDAVDCDVCTNATEESSWGEIKALYAD